MLYKYTAKLSNGTLIEDKREAEDKIALSRELREEGVSLVVAHEMSGGFDFSSINNMFSRVSLHEKVIFTRNLAAMLKAGISLSRSLGILEKQTTNFRLKTVLNVLLETINKGGNLSEGMKKFPNVFSSLFVSMVHSGEESGSLPDSLLAIGGQLEKSYALGKKVRGAMMYPAVVLSAVFLIGALMLIYVVPTLTSTFRDMKAELPGSTKLVIFISDFMIAHTTSAVLFIFGIICACFFGLRTERGVRAWSYAVLRAPVFGMIVKQVNAARTARTMTSLLSAGVDVRQALTISKDVLQNVYYKDVFDQAIGAVEKGFSLSQVFKGRSDLYPIMVGEMMEIGEETGKLSDMLENIASFYEGEVEAITNDLSTLLEPILMVIIGGAVGFFAVSMISPMYSILNSV